MNTFSLHDVSNSNEPGNPIEQISIYSSNQFTGNARSYTRYVRDDIEVTIKAGRLFERQFTSARVIDISQKGACILSKKLLQDNKRLFLKFTFEDGQTFLFRARIVRRIKRKGLPYLYGVEFENRDALFKEHLLKTQLRSNLKKRFYDQAADNQPERID